MFSVEAVLESSLDAAVRREWGVLADAGLPSAGRHPSPSNAPHVTLAVRDDLAPDDVAPLVSHLPIPVVLGGMVVFGAGERFVLARPVVMTRRLRELHTAIVDRVGPPPERYAVTAVDAWTPHVTLARRMTATQIGEALALLGAQPREGALTELRVWDSDAKVLTRLPSGGLAGQSASARARKG